MSDMRIIRVYPPERMTSLGYGDWRLKCGVECFTIYEKSNYYAQRMGYALGKECDSKGCSIGRPWGHILHPRVIAALAKWWHPSIDTKDESTKDKLEREGVEIKAGYELEIPSLEEAKEIIRQYGIPTYPEDAASLDFSEDESKMEVIETLKPEDVEFHKSEGMM